MRRATSFAPGLRGASSLVQNLWRMASLGHHGDLSRRRLSDTLAMGVLACCLTHALPQAVAQDSKTWTTSSFVELIDGSFADGGVNTYVAADGSVRLINLWDLNDDGNLDVVFPSDHDRSDKVDLFIYWGQDGFDPDRRLRLPANGAISGTAADLNGDEFLDLVVVNRSNYTRTDLDSFIYWGSSAGFDPSRRSGLPTRGAEAVAASDLNRDGHADLVFANSGRSFHMSVDRYQKSFIYWGSADGYRKSDRSSLKTINARDVEVADLNQDGFPEIVFAMEGNQEGEGGALLYWGSAGGRYSGGASLFLPGERSSGLALGDLDGDDLPEIVLANSRRLRDLEFDQYEIVETVAIDSFVYQSSPDGYSPHRKLRLPTVGAQAAATGDLNGDGHPDIVFANSAGGISYIYWGHAGEFRANWRTALPTRWAADCTIKDLDGDGHAELLFAHYSDGAVRKPAETGISHATESYVYWGGPEGPDPGRRTELPGWGATGILAEDLNRDGEKDLVFFNKRDGTSPTPVYIYWGDDGGRFDAGRREDLPRGGGSYTSVDFDQDGRVDLSFSSVIYWGRPEGYSVRDETLLWSRGMAGRAADLNRDGYLDLALAEWRAGSSVTHVYWGGPVGFSEANRLALPATDLRGLTLGDLDQNGWVDLVFAGINKQVLIYWNSSGGFDPENHTRLPVRAAVSVQVADLDGNGHLDLIAANLFDLDTPRDTMHTEDGLPLIYGGSPRGDAFIYWGGRDPDHPFSQAHRSILPVLGASKSAAADLNGDGLLDLVVSSYHGGDTRSNPSYIYWNSESGFSADRVTRLASDSAAGVLASDFDRDGHVDILLQCHQKDGNHRTDSFLYWGGPEGFSPLRRTALPSRGPHGFAGVDIGQAYDRSDRYDYVSPVFDAGRSVRLRSLNWSGRTPHRTSLEFQLRGAPSRKQLEAAPWIGPSGPGTYYSEPGTPLAGQARWIQYKASLVSPQSANSPILESVSIEYEETGP